MGKPSNPTFRAGGNIAMKVPPHQFDRTVAFYRDTVKLPHLKTAGSSEVFAFGEMRLWIDRMPQLSQAEVWLEFETDDTEAAAKHLAAHDVARCDAIEPLPEGFDGFWITNPGSIVHLVGKSGSDD